MKTEHKYAQVLRWIADGETVQLGGHGGWTDIPNINATLAAIGGHCAVPPERFRLKPRTITVNGREIVAGESKPPYGKYFAADTMQYDYFMEYTWTDQECDSRFLERGLVHLTKENAIAHAKAMLGID